MSSNLIEIATNNVKFSNLRQADSGNFAANNDESGSNNLLDFYNRYYSKPDRRNNNKLVDNEQRAQSDRRQQQRIPQISDDVYQVRKVFNNFENTSKEVKAQVDKFDEFISKNSTPATDMLTALSSFIPFRRVTSVPKKLEEKDYGGALMSLGVATTLLPEDLRDVKDATKQLNSVILPDKFKEFVKKKNPKIFEDFINYAPKYDPKEFQVPFSFVRGSFLEKIVNKHPNKFAYMIHKNDKALFDTKLGEIVGKILKVNINNQFVTSREVPFVDLVDDGKFILDYKRPIAFKLEGSRLGKLICRSLQRTTVYGTIAISLVSLPSIIKAFVNPKNIKDKFKNAGRQAAKTTIYIATSLAGIALGGAILGSLGPLGSVVGMGLGCTIGSFTANKIVKSLKLDKNYLEDKA